MRCPDACVLFYSAVVLRGRCECNAVAYELEDAFVAALNCHCSNCRAMTGAMFLPFGEIERGKLRVTTGADLVMVKGDAAAYHEARCQACLSLLYWSPDGTRVRVPYGTLVDEPSLKPNRASVRGVEGFVARDPRRPTAIRRAPRVISPAGVGQSRTAAPRP